MKKITKILLAAFMVLSSLFGLSFTSNARALAITTINDNAIRSTAYEYLLSFVQYGAIARKNLVRTAGTAGEYYASLSIANYLELMGLEAKTHDQDSSILENQSGCQRFSFSDIYSGEKKTSYNLIYTIKGASSQKKVVISTNYDNDYIGYYDQEDQDYLVTEGEDFSEGVNASAASVAALLTLAEVLPQGYFDFDIEMVFFGAGYNNNAGARYYNQTMNKTERDSVLLMLDVSRIALGNKMYYYSGAFGSHADELYQKSLNLNKFKHNTHGVGLESDSTMLGYTNAGYSSSTTVFEGSGVNVLHMFAGDYEQGIFAGYSEYVGVSNITNSQNDSIDYILSTYDKDLTDNMTLVCRSIIDLLNSSDFINTLSAKPNEKPYKMFSARQYISLIMLVLLIVLMIIAIIIHYSISKKTYKYISDNKISGVMIQLDEEDKTQKKK